LKRGGNPVTKKKDQGRVLIPAEWFEAETKFGAHLLGLTAWDISVVVTPKYRSGSYCEGECKPHDGHLTAKIYYRQDVLKGEARYNVYHELGHLLFRAWTVADQHVLDDMVPELLGKQAVNVLTKGEEDAVERFAHTIVRLLPAERTEPDGIAV
jgi:hypothetical protein